MDRKAFLVPMAVSIAAVVTDVGNASLRILDRIKTETYEARAAPSAQQLAHTPRPESINADEQTLLLHRPIGGAMLAQHSSHSSHGSHGSHGSHSSGGY